MQDPTHKKSCTPSEGNSLIDRQSKDTELNVIFKLFADGKSKTVPELAQLTGFSNSAVCEQLKIILSWKVVEYTGTPEGTLFRTYTMRKGAGNE